MHTVTLEYAHAHLKELLVEVSTGEEIVIVENARPLGRLVAERAVAVPSEQQGGWPFWNWYEADVRLPEQLDEPIPSEYWEVLKS